MNITSLKAASRKPHFLLILFSSLAVGLPVQGGGDDHGAGHGEVAHPPKDAPNVTTAAHGSPQAPGSPAPGFSSTDKAHLSSLADAGQMAENEVETHGGNELQQASHESLGDYLDRQRRGGDNKGHEQADVVTFPVLKPTEEFAENPNINPNAPKNKVDPGEQWQLREYRIQLRVARDLRLGDNVDQAIINLVQLMDSRAPDEIKSEAMFELGIAAQQQGNLVRAQQIFSHYIARFPKNPNIPEATLRQGIIHRQMGAHTLALSKFYAVLSSALKLETTYFDHYKLMVLKAQTEIADTYYLTGEFKSATEFYERLLELESPILMKPLIHYKLIRCLGYQERFAEVISRSLSFIEQYPNAEENTEVRFILAGTYKKLGRNRDALEQVLALLEAERSISDSDPQRWIYWQQRTGNEIANQLYKDGDNLSALEIYVNLSSLSESAEWQLPVWYQMGLIYERLQQPAMATEVYDRIVSREVELGKTPAASMKTLLDMARWRRDFIGWRVKAEEAAKGNFIASDPPGMKPKLADP